MGGQESLWRVGGRFFRLVLLLDCALMAGVVALSSLDGSLSAREFVRNTWILCLLIAVLWLVYELGRNGTARVAPPGGEWASFGRELEPYLQLRPAKAAAWEMTVLTVALVAGLAVVALTVQVAT